ncbi:MAG: TlpA family protein disulfide reductase [Aridibacter sp.]
MKYLSKFITLFSIIFAVSQISYSQTIFEVKTDVNSNTDLLPNTTIPSINVEFVGKNALVLKKEPKFNSKQLFYGKSILGDSLKHQNIIIILDEKENEKKRIFIDVNNNGDLTDDGDAFWTDEKEGILSKSVLINVVLNENGIDKKINLPYKILRYENPLNKQIRVVLRSEYLREGKLSLGDKTYTILAQTFNRQGLFSDPKDITLGIDRDQDGVIDKSLLSAEIFWGGNGGGKPFNVAGETYFIEKSSASGDKILLAVSKEKVAPKNYIAIGKSAPEFSFKDVKGEKVSLKTLGNKIILLDFWATWCIPCVRNIPKLKKLTEKFSAEDFAIVGISADGGTNEITFDKFKEFLDKRGINWHSSFENQGIESDIIKSYNIVDFPLYIIVDKQGIIQLIERGGGEQGVKRIDDTVQKLLGK